MQANCYHSPSQNLGSETSEQQAAALRRQAAECRSAAQGLLVKLEQLKASREKCSCLCVVQVSVAVLGPLCCNDSGYLLGQRCYLPGYD